MHGNKCSNVHFDADLSSCCCSLFFNMFYKQPAMWTAIELTTCCLDCCRCACKIIIIFYRNWYQTELRNPNDIWMHILHSFSHSMQSYLNYSTTTNNLPYEFFGALFIANGDLIFHWQQFTAFGQWNNRNQFKVFLWRHYLFTTRALYSLLSGISAMNLLRNWILNLKHKEITIKRKRDLGDSPNTYSTFFLHLLNDLISNSESHKLQAFNI